MVEKENEIEIKSLAIQEDIDKKLGDISKELKLLKSSSDKAFSQINTLYGNLVSINSHNSFILEFYGAFSILIAVCIFLYEISHSYIPLVIIFLYYY